MKRTLTLAALVLLASGSAAFAAVPDAVSQAFCARCDACSAGADSSACC